MKNCWMSQCRDSFVGWSSWPALKKESIGAVHREYMHVAQLHRSICWIVLKRHGQRLAFCDSCGYGESPYGRLNSTPCRSRQLSLDWKRSESFAWKSDPSTHVLHCTQVRRRLQVESMLSLFFARNFIIDITAELQFGVWSVKILSVSCPSNHKTTRRLQDSTCAVYPKLTVSKVRLRRISFF